MRTCSECGEEMNEGFLHEESGQTFCSIACTDENFTIGELEAMSIDDLFWTNWYDEEETH